MPSCYSLPRMSEATKLVTGAALQADVAGFDSLASY